MVALIRTALMRAMSIIRATPESTRADLGITPRGNRAEEHHSRPSWLLPTETDKLAGIGVRPAQPLVPVSADSALSGEPVFDPLQISNH